MSRNRYFAPLALTTALLTIGLIIFGAVVRVTDSGLGCGNSWPLCNGTIFPPLDNMTAWIEWLHRLFALLIGIFGLITLGVAISAYRRQNRMVLTYTVIAAVLFSVQSMLGALVVVLDLPPTFITLHLGTSMLLFAALLVAAVLALYQPRLPHKRDSVTWLVYVTAALSFAIMLTGALVRGSGATLACVGWPLCNGVILPTNQGQLALIHMLHRFSVLALGITLALLVWYVLRQRHERIVRVLAISAALSYLAQAAVGAFLVLSAAAPVWGALHVGFAASTWGVLVALSAIEAVNTREQTAKATWQPQPDPLQA